MKAFVFLAGVVAVLAVFCVAVALHELVQAVDAVTGRDELRLAIRDRDQERLIDARFRFRRDPNGTSAIAFLLDRTPQPES